MSNKSTPKKRKIDEAEFETDSSMVTPSVRMKEEATFSVKIKEEGALAAASLNSFTTPSAKPRTVEYLDKMEKELAATPAVYNEFLRTMKQFKSQALNSTEVVSRIRTLFKEHEALWIGFNDFLPDTLDTK